MYFPSFSSKLFMILVFLEFKNLVGCNVSNLHVGSGNKGRNWGAPLREVKEELKGVQ